MISITFLGAARTVTGSKYLVESNGARLMVDAGLFQGLKELRLRNWQDMPVAASSIQAIVLTHAHLDHCGYLPRLVAQGFRGRVFCTQGTQDLCRIVLPDSGRLQEEDAEYANRHQFSKHQPTLPLYREVDASRALTLLQPVGYDRPMPVASGIDGELDPELQPEQHDDTAPHDAAAAPTPAAIRRRQAMQERAMCVFCTERFRVIASPDESKALTASRKPAIVISSSGMAEGGRVL